MSNSFRAGDLVAMIDDRDALWGVVCDVADDQHMLIGVRWFWMGEKVRYTDRQLKRCAASFGGRRPCSSQVTS